MGQNKVSNRVCALDGVLVPVKGVQEPRVFGSNKLARFLICPQLEGSTLAMRCTPRVFSQWVWGLSVFSGGDGTGARTIYS